MKYIEGTKGFEVSVGIDLEKNEQYVLRIINNPEDTGSDYYENLEIGFDIYKDYKFHKEGDYFELGYADWKWVREASEVLENDGVCAKDIMWPGSAVILPDFIDREGKVVQYHASYASIPFTTLVKYHNENKN